LIEADSYLLPLVRYIHRNPLEAGLAKSLEDYPWTSHQGYLSMSHKWKWLYREIVWEMLTGNLSARFGAYRKFIMGEDSKGLSQIFSGKRWPVFLGSEGFLTGVKGRFFLKKADIEVPDRKTLAPDLDFLLEAVKKEFRVKQEDLLYSRRGYYNEPRNVAIYLVRKLRGDRLKEIGEVFRIAGYSAVSSVVQRVNADIKREERLRKRVHNLIAIISKSQEQT
jgi:hypothetical protein